jgi:serine-type D-Ala-D-Ala carboxypeptidase/endopeptidase
MKRRALVVCVAALGLSSILRPVLAAPQGTGSSPSLPSDAQIREMLADRVDVQRRNIGIVVGIVSPAGRRVIPYGRFGRDDSRALNARVPAGYDAELQPAPAWVVPTLAGAGALHSSANDLLTFLASLDGDRSPLAGVMTTMLETRRPGRGIPQALGWWIVATGPGDDGIVTHDGCTLGFSSAIAYDRKTRTGVVVLSNTADGVGDIARHVLRPVIPLTKPAGVAPQKTEVPVDPRIFDRYAGRYEPAPGIAFTVARDGDWLMIELPGVPKLQLRPESERAFFVAENTRVTVTFEADPDGHVTLLLLRSPDGETRATRVEGR